MRWQFILYLDDTNTVFLLRMLVIGLKPKVTRSG